MTYIKKTARHTIQDGKVITFAENFEEQDGLMKSWKATGIFEVSASRNKVMVHRAEVRTQMQGNLLISAIILARNAHMDLASVDGRPRDGWDGSPIKIDIQDILESNPILDFINTKNLRSN